MTTARRRALAGLLSTALLLAAAPAAAGELFAYGSASGGTSTWQGDPSGYGALRLGYRFADLVGVYGMGRLGYSAVDERVITLIAIGADIRGHLGSTRPYARLSLTHQHEESVDAIEGDWGGALFGVGDGIRHRAGAEAAVGLELPLYHKDKVDLCGFAETSLLWNPDSKGPHLYVLGGLGLGIAYRL